MIESVLTAPLSGAMSGKHSCVANHSASSARSANGLFQPRFATTSTGTQQMKRTMISGEVRSNLFARRVTVAQSKSWNDTELNVVAVLTVGLWLATILGI